MTREEETTLYDLTGDQEATLAQCLQALDAGVALEAVLGRFPAHADALRPYLTLRARLHEASAPEPAPRAYAAGREALLQRLAAGQAGLAAAPASHGTRLPGWLRPQLVRAAFAGLALFALAGGVIGASAAAGVDRAHDVLSSLHIVSDSPPHVELPPRPNTPAGEPNGGSIVDPLNKANEAMTPEAGDQTADGAADAQPTADGTGADNSEATASTESPGGEKTPHAGVDQGVQTPEPDRPQQQRESNSHAPAPSDAPQRNAEEPHGES